MMELLQLLHAFTCPKVGGRNLANRVVTKKGPIQIEGDEEGVS